MRVQGVPGGRAQSGREKILQQKRPCHRGCAVGRPVWSVCAAL